MEWLAAVETHARPKPGPGCLDKEQAEAAAEVWLQESFFAQEQDTEGRHLGCVRRRAHVCCTAGRRQHGWSAAARLVGGSAR